VLAVTILTLFSHSGGEPFLAGWSLSLFLVFYLFGCTCFFSTAATPVPTVQNLHLPLVCWSSRFLRRLSYKQRVWHGRIVIIYLDSVLAAGLFGNTLAQYRESNGTERATIVANASVHETRLKLGLYLLLGVMTLGNASGLLWMIFRADGKALLVATALLASLNYLMFICYKSDRQ
jgi:hypothetical protein